MLALVQDKFDEQWEDTLSRDEEDVEIWLEYAHDKLRRGLEKSSVCAVFERALHVLPGSYKLWHTYLNLRREWLSALPPESLCSATNSFVASLNALFARALKYMRLYPQIWLLYIEFLSVQRGTVGQVRKIFDSALRELPITQHSVIWHAYAKWVLNHPALPPQVGKSVLTRMAMFTGSNAKLVEYLKSTKQYNDAVQELLHSNSNVSVLDVLHLCEASPEAAAPHVEELVKMCKAMQVYEDKMQALQMLGDLLVRLGEFDLCREVFEYALFDVCESLTHFTRMFESFSQVEEALMDGSKYRNKRMRRLLDDREVVMNEKLFLLKWPGDVKERIAYAESQTGRQTEIILAAFPSASSEDAPPPIDLYNGTGADLFKYLDDLELACRTLQNPRELTEVWRLRIERALQQEQGGAKQAVRLCKEALASSKLQRSGDLWALYLDLEQCYGTLDTTRAAYESAIQVKTISLLGVLNYCSLLQQESYFEDSFNVFERAIPLFPNAQDLYVEYTKTFVSRYGGAKLERVRDLFEQWIRTLQHGGDANLAFFLYAKFESEYGLTRNVMQVCERWTKHPQLQKGRRCEAYLYWAHKSEEYFGSPSVRDIFNVAMKDVDLKDNEVVQICIHYANAERRLGENERARAIYKHGAYFQDPSSAGDKSLWDAWSAFEVSQGNEDTFHEMLRVKRTVQVHYSMLHSTAPPSPAVEEEETVQQEAAGANPEEITLED